MSPPTAPQTRFLAVPWVRLDIAFTRHYLDSAPAALGLPWFEVRRGEAKPLDCEVHLGRTRIVIGRADPAWIWTLRHGWVARV